MMKDLYSTKHGQLVQEGKLTETGEALLMKSIREKTIAEVAAMVLIVIAGVVTMMSVVLGTVAGMYYLDAWSKTL